jgi:alkyl sulfatase BDS1-like metallo-beta-lactamase superfamily hydrolase
MTHSTSTDAAKTPPASELKVAAMIQSGEGQSAAIERAPGIYESRGIGNSYLITTAEGNLLVNAGTLGDAKRSVELFKQVSAQPIRYIVLTQSHANQFGGLEVFKTPHNQVIAHRIYPQDRVYSQALQQHYQRGSRRIFSSVTGTKDNILPTHEIAPDLLVDEFHALELGGRRIEIHWTPGGETRSALIVWLPDQKIAFVGNLFGPLFGNHPNLNTLRGDKPRSALEFIESVKAVRALAPELILTGHEVIKGGEHIQQQLNRIIDAVQWVHDRTLEGMEAGTPLSALMREIQTPPQLTLTEEYGKVAWNVRAIWHEYTGWYDPSRGLTELFDVPASSVANAIAELTGGIQPLVTRAEQFVQAGEPLQALHLLEIVFASGSGSGDDPTDNLAAARAAKRQALELLNEQIDGKNLWERMSIAAELRELGTS